MNDLSIQNIDFYNLVDKFRHDKAVSIIKFSGFGISMTPFIRNGDTLTIKLLQKDDNVKTGNIVIVQDRGGKKLFVHRIVQSKKRAYLLKGDNKLQPDGWFSRDMILGRIDKLTRGSKTNIPVKHWQSVVIAFFSKAGILNSTILPFGRWVKRKLGR